MSNKLVQVWTNRDKDVSFMTDMAEEFLALAKEGKVKQAAIIYEEINGELKCSRCSSSALSLLGLLEWIKGHWLMNWKDDIQ